MIYTTGTIAINGNTVTGTGTNFSAPLSLIRVGCTLIAISNPIQIFTITEIKSGTELSVTPAANPAIAAGTKFSILLSDSISVDGLAQDVAETLRFYQEKEDEISSAIDGSNIGLGPEPRDCTDISGDPSSYVGFLRIKETTKGFPSVAAGESFLSGFICQRDTTPSYTGVFVGWSTRSLYTYTWIASSGANWTRNARKNDVDKLKQLGSETHLLNPNEKAKILITSDKLWGAYDIENSKYIPLAIAHGGTGALTAYEARNNLNLGESNAVKFKNLTLTEALDANLGMLVKTGIDWNTQQSGTLGKFKPIVGNVNGPDDPSVFSGFHIDFIGNYATQFAGRNSKFYARSIEAGVDNGWRQLATINTENTWTKPNTFSNTLTTNNLAVTNGGKTTRILTGGSSAKNVEIYVWGSESRATVIEFKIKNTGTDASEGWIFYGQQNADNSYQLQVNGAVNCTTVNQQSDRDLKDNIHVIGDATEAIRKMNGYTYTLKENGLPYAGVIAQEVMEALPEAVGSFTHYGEALQGPTIDGNELREETRYLNVDYAAVTGLLVQVARETDNRVTELEEENDSLRANISVMDERIAKLEALVSKLTGSEK
ncbi:tail fiber domain-containing protein [Escherichia coli]|nr:tail fiber domain-containing protein [Escherichia coli]MCK3539225.1 tail fiber domain-containing protein [Escherichia coli]